MGVDPAGVWCDAAEFRRALENEEPERALKLYAGEFLPGFQLSGTPELEKWLDHLRLDLQRRALDAALHYVLARDPTRPRADLLAELASLRAFRNSRSSGTSLQMACSP